MKFKHIQEAIAYAQLTGDMDSFNEYMSKHIDAAAQRMNKALTPHLEGDDLFFWFAFAKSFVDVTEASMSDEEREIAAIIRKAIQIQVVKTVLPIPVDGDQIVGNGATPIEDEDFFNDGGMPQ